jgi:membrane protein DedA with SNARE-associated domain
VNASPETMHEHLLNLIELVRPYVDQYGYIILFLGVMLENASLPVPGETILIIASFYSYHGNLILTDVILLASLGCILGDNISFYVGRRLGRPFITQYGKYFFVTPHRLAQVESFFQRHGDKTIFLQRWITGVRVIGALVAGTTKMPWSRFLLFNCLGAVTWVTAISLLAYLFAVNLPILLKILTRSGWMFLGLLVLGFLVIYWRRRMAVDREAPPA